MSEDTPEETDRTETAEEPSDLTSAVTLPHSSETYKVLGELADADGVGVLGHNTATTGAAVGIRGVTDSTGGYGLYTPDDARIDGVAELTALSGSLTGGTETTDLLGDTLAVDGSGTLTWTGTYKTDTFTATGTTWNAVSGLSGTAAVDVTVDAKEVALGRIRLEVDGTLAAVAGAREVLHTVVEATSSVTLVSDEFYTFDTFFDVSGEDVAQYGVDLKPDGTRMFTGGTGSSNVYAYDLSTAWDLDTASYTGNSFDVSGQDEDPIAITFRGDGTDMFVLGRNTGAVYSYGLSTAWDITTASFDSSYAISEDGSPRGVTFRDDGTRMFAVGEGEATVFAYTLGTAWDLTTASFSGDSYAIPGEEAKTTAVDFDGTGERMYVLGEGTDSLYTFELSTAWDVTTATPADQLAVEGLGTGDVAVRDDGTSLYICSAFDDVVRQYDERYSGTARAALQR